jgi:hypothetical protein
LYYESITKYQQFIYILTFARRYRNYLKLGQYSLSLKSKTLISQWAAIVLWVHSFLSGRSLPMYSIAFQNVGHYPIKKVIFILCDFFHILHEVKNDIRIKWDNENSKFLYLSIHLENSLARGYIVAWSTRRKLKDIRCEIKKEQSSHARIRSGSKITLGLRKRLLGLRVESLSKQFTPKIPTPFPLHTSKCKELRWWW